MRLEVPNPPTPPLPSIPISTPVSQIIGFIVSFVVQSSFMWVLLVPIRFHRFHQRLLLFIDVLSISLCPVFFIRARYLCWFCNETQEFCLRNLSWMRVCVCVLCNNTIDLQSRTFQRETLNYQSRPPHLLRRTIDSFSETSSEQEHRKKTIKTDSNHPRSPRGNHGRATCGQGCLLSYSWTRPQTCGDLQPPPPPLQRQAQPQPQLQLQQPQEQ